MLCVRYAGQVHGLNIYIYIHVLCVFVTLCVSICRPTGLSAGTFPCVCLCVYVLMCVAKGHLISRLAARHACVQVVCPHLGAEQI